MPSVVQTLLYFDQIVCFEVRIVVHFARWQQVLKLSLNINHNIIIGYLKFLIRYCLDSYAPYLVFRELLILSIL